MIKKCEIHQKYEVQQICIHKTRLLKEGNKFSCQKCVNWQKSDKFIKNKDEIEEESRENFAKYVEMQNQIIVINDEKKQKYIQQINDLKERLNLYFSKQLKTITSLIDQQNQILTQNINKADSLFNQPSVLDSESIDNLIVFINLNEENQQIIQNKYTQINNCLERQFNYEFSEVVYKVNQFITMDFNFNNVPFYEEEQFKIETVDNKKEQMTYCQIHYQEQNCICTQEDCLKKQNQQQACYQCSMINHQHFGPNCVKPLKKIQVEQSEKLQLIKQLDKLLQQELETIIDQELQKNQQSQSQIFLNFQTIRGNLKLLETQTKINIFNKNPNYIFYNIDQNLLPYDVNQIRQEFENKLKNLQCLIQQQQNQITKGMEKIQVQISEIHKAGFQNKNPLQNPNIQEQQINKIIGIILFFLAFIFILGAASQGQQNRNNKY